MDLFDFNKEKILRSSAPLADRLRPTKLDEFVGQKHLVGNNKFLYRIIKTDRISSMLFYGPPGVGKTTLAKIIARSTNKNFVELSAVSSNLKELREILKNAEDNLKYDGVSTIVFIDEIHRFNKSQQDALLPFVERGIVILIGATTENPYFEVNKALLSRMQILNLEELSSQDLNELIDRALREKNGLSNYNVDLKDDARDFLIKRSAGDGRTLLNSLEIAVLSTEKNNGVVEITTEVLEDSFQQKAVKYDKDGNEHYDTISAFIKSIRGSDPDAAIYYLAKMLNSGEDIKFIARRLIILASEDIGNANPMAMVIASSCFNSINVVGMPEARIILAQATTYLASSKKSNAAYVSINEALRDVREEITGNIPIYLRDKHNPKNESDIEYKYPHSYENSYVEQQYLPDEFVDKKYYRPKEIGYESEIKKYLDNLK